MAKIKFSNHNLEIEILSGSDFLEIHHKYPNIPLKFSCKRGDCGTCMIKVVKGQENLTKISQLERVTLQKKGCDLNCRLACQCAVNGSVEIES